jgi:membrane fusion protein (multidrug efflux system)
LAQIRRFSCRIGLVLVVACLVCACDKKPSPPPPPPPKVSVVTVQPQSVGLTTELPGRMVAYRVADIRPQVSGIILKRFFVEGGDVRAGQQLYQIDPAPYQASYDSAVAALDAASQLSKRDKLLADVAAVSKQDYANAAAQARQDAASVETARINLVYTKLLSPLSGRIGRSSVTEGALVTADQTTALATVQQLDPIYVDVQQPSNVLLRLQRELAKGQLKRAGAGEAEVHLVLEDGTPYEPTGRLQFSEVVVDQTTGSVTLRALFPNPEHLLLPGMFVHERIEEGQRDGIILVPQQAVTRDPKGSPTALVVGADDKVELRQLTTDRAIGDQWMVTSGLAAGDRVIVEGVQFAQPGATVQPEPWQPPGAAAPASPR